MEGLNEKITTETLRKIASSEEYDENEMLCVAEYLANLYEYEFESQFGLVIAEEPSKSRTLAKIKELELRERPFFCVFRTGVKHWVCLAISHLHDSTVVLYKDSFGAQLPHKLREAIGDHLRDRKVRFESHRGTEQNDESSSGPICLRNLQVFMKGFKTDAIKVPLIEKFQKVRFCSQYGVQSVKREFRLWLQKYLLCGLEEVAAELLEDKDYEEFRVALSAFLIVCSKILKETYLLSSNYMSLLKNDARKKDQDPRYETDHKTSKLIKDARDNFYKNSEVQKSLKFDKDDFVDLDNDNKVYNLDIQERFPEQMQKFTKIFAVLAQAEMTEELEKAIKKICEMLNLDYDSIKIYFIQNKVPKRPNFMRGEPESPNSVQNLEKGVEVMKCKIKEAKSEAKKNPGKSEIKSLEQLVSELVLDAQGTAPDEEEAKAQETKRIVEDFAKVMRHYKEWATRSVPEIAKYGSGCRAEEKPFDADRICEAIAVMDRANELATGGQRLRVPQILAVLVFLGSSVSYRGKLCQIESGEGKTLIVSLLATIMILQGEKAVDVITSNGVLAQEGVSSRKLFYSMFNISVATNIADKAYAQGSRKCYQADVVYGSISDFQFDYLRDTADGLGTMSGRQFGRVILDEVDNMLVDNGRNIAKISIPFPGMENLKYIYVRIWSELLSVESELVEDFEEKLKEFAAYDNSKEMAVREFVKIFDASMIGRMEERMKANLKDLDTRFVPSHCLEYAESMIPRWIGNAIRARYFMKQNEQYSVKEIEAERSVMPVDYSNTGVTLKNTVWSYGLHQFVQMKHNLRLTPESLTSSCVSNYAYIGKYGNKIFGLTGTLGSKAEQDLLSSIYNVDYARLPTYKAKRFREYGGLTVPDDDWSFEVVLTTIGIVRSTGQAVLIICKTIADLLQLEEQFESAKSLNWDCKIRIKKFQDEDTADVTHETVTPGDVIVATNIAGRGADFKTSPELEANGGLHVCVGFCPDNERVRDQAYFRTSRQGNRGSAQLLVRESEIRRLGIDTTDLDGIDFNEVKRRIDIIEVDRLNDIKKSKVDVLRYEDALFTLFSDLCQELKNNNVITWGHSYLMKDLKEFWAFWLESQNFEGKVFSLKEASFIFFKFKNHEKTRKIISGTISHNPYYGVLQADFFLKNDEIEKAKAALVNAICLSKNANVMYSAFIALFDSTLDEKGPLIQKFKSFLYKVFSSDSRTEEKPSKYASEIFEYLMIAHAGLTQEINYLESYYFNIDYNDDFMRVITLPEKNKDNLLIKHLVAKLTCLKVFCGNVDILLELVEGTDTQSLIISKRITDYLKNFKPDTKEEKQTKNLLTDPELMELGAKGLKTIYSLRKIAIVQDSTLTKAKTQILGSLALIARGTAFPPLNFAVANIASILVSEAIALMVLAFFKETNNLDDLLQKSEYLKGKILSYVTSLMISGHLNTNVCMKIFLRMVRCYRESYYLLEHATDNVRLMKSVNSTQISKNAKEVEDQAENGSASEMKRIRVPKALAQQFFESSIANTVIGSIVDFVIDKAPKVTDEKSKNVSDKAPKKRSSYFQPRKDQRTFPKMEKYFADSCPTRFGGSFEKLLEHYPKGLEPLGVRPLIEESCYRETAYASIPRSQLPSILMLERDYRALRKLRYAEKEEGTYHRKRREVMAKGDYWLALVSDISDVLALSKFYASFGREHVNYNLALVQLLQYCKDVEITGAPEVSSIVPKGRLISQEQYNLIVKEFKLK